MQMRAKRPKKNESINDRNFLPDVDKLNLSVDTTSKRITNKALLLLVGAYLIQHSLKVFSLLRLSNKIKTVFKLFTKTKNAIK